MSDALDRPASDAAPGKKPLDEHLFVGSRGTVDDVRVQTGYPIRYLIGAWMASNYDDDEVIAGYADMPREEWEAAKRYYFDHKIVFDARIITDSQPGAEEDVPPMTSVEEYFAWLEQNNKPSSSSGTP